MADPYRPQLSQQSVPMPEASAEDFGAAAARGLEEAGTTIDRAIHQRREADRDLQAANAGVELANASTELDKLAIDARSTAAPGGEGHTDAIAKAIDERQKAALANIRDPHIRAAFGQRWAQLRDNLETREYGWQAGARVDKLAADVDQTGTTLANGMASNPNGAGLELSLSTIETSIGAMAIPADLKTKLIREQQRKIAAAYGNAMVDKDPRLLVGDEASKTPGLLDKGVLSQYLEPEDLDRLRSGAHVELRRQDVEARQQLAIEKASWIENTAVLRKRATELADPTITDAELDTIAAGAEKFGDKSVALEVAQWRDYRDTAKESRTWTQATWDEKTNALEAKAAKGTITPQETVHLATLKKLRPAAVARLNDDPFGAAAARGQAAPDLDWNDPGSVQRRVTWARSQRSAGAMTFTPYLDKTELAELRGELQNGTAGQLSVASKLRNTFGVGPATEIVKQLDANNKDLQLIVGLDPRVAELYKKGAAALKLHPKLAGEDQLDKDQLREIFAPYAEAIADPEMANAVFNGAVNVMAGRAFEINKTELAGGELAATFPQFVDLAAGRKGSNPDVPGGFAKWYGRYVWLPPTINRHDFQTRMSRADAAAWRHAGAGDLYRAGPDGRRVKVSDAELSQLSRRQLGATSSPGVYSVLGADGRPFLDKNGKVWTFQIGKLR